MSGKLKISKEVMQKRVKEIQDLYSGGEDVNKSFSAIVMGERGSGKTLFSCSGRRRVLLDSFDPKSTVVIEQFYPEELANGDIIIRKFWDEDSKNPTQFKLWEEQFRRDIDDGFIGSMGTYVIDSMTTWLDTIAHYVSRTNNRPKNTLAIQDYPVIYDYVKDTIKSASSQNCDFILTAHLVLEQDEISGAITAEIKAYKSLKVDIPLLFSEKYIMRKVQSGSTVKHELLTNSAGRYLASTQLGAKGILKDVEQPNLTEILKKVGYV